MYAINALSETLSFNSPGQQMQLRVFIRVFRLGEWGGIDWMGGILSEVSVLRHLDDLVNWTLY